MEVNIWQPPEQFNFARAMDWPRWITRFNRYREASGLDTKPNSQQISSLIYCMGPQGDDVFLSLQLPEDKRKDFNEVVKAFDTHFIPKRNIIYERSMFNQRFQRDGETVDEFITSLHALAEHCEFGALRDDFIRDRIVVGVRDRSMTEKLQLRNDLTLELATSLVKQSEQVKQQIPHLQSECSKVEVNQVMSRQRKKTTFFKQKCQATTKPKSTCPDTRQHAYKQCGWCGGDPHQRAACPAAEAKCAKCKKKGHYAKVCRSSASSKAIHGVTEVPDSFIGTVPTAVATAETHRNPYQSKGKWSVSIEIANCRISCKADTGAETTCISEETYRSFFEDKRLRPPEKRLYNADNHVMQTLGFFWETIKYKGRSVLVDIYVIAGLDRALLDGDTCEKLGILMRCDVDAVSSQNKQRMSFDPQKVYPQLFQGLGRVKIPYHISLNHDAVPYALTTPRRVPIPMLKEIKCNLDNMVLLGVIEPVEEPTSWCSGLVLVPKPNGTIRMCVDYVRLNKFVQREIYPMPATENILGRLGKGKFFSKLDANHGFWQCELDPESQLLTTFITPYGRYKYKRLPFGINAAPEFFQKRMSQILQGLEGVQINIDDILVYGESMKEHDDRLHQVFQRLQKAGVTLNVDKCSFGVTQVKFLGHIINADGVHVDDERVKAIKDMEQPQSVSELRSLLGSVNYLSKFIPHLATKAHALNELLSDRNEFKWGSDQQRAFEDIKEALSKAPTLAWFDPSRETVVTADASSYGVGAVLKQRQDDGNFRPVAYASKTLTTHQKRWAQIEKEGYALVWACERFRDFITGIRISLETDHKPLVSIFSTKELDEISPKLQRMRLRLARYVYEIRHIPGKELGAADILSRRPLQQAEDDDDLEQEVVAYVQMVTNHLPATDTKLQEIYEAQLTDVVSIQLREYCLNGWPTKESLQAELQEFWRHRSDISVQEGLVMKSSRIYIPTGPLRRDILLRIHEGHQGIVKCRARMRDSVWWPNSSVDVENLVRKCPQCIVESTNAHEPLIPSAFPQRPWQKVGMDLFKLSGKWYLIVTDYYSRYPEIATLASLHENVVITHLKSIFSRHGTPQEVCSDNGTQFGSIYTSKFAQFARDWGFKHSTSSPKFPQSNGFIEASVKIIKKSLAKSDDAYRALQSYRATPLSNGYSPAELLMGRRLRTSIPMTSQHLIPQLPNTQILHKREAETRTQQKLSYDRRHRTRDLPELREGDRVWIIDLRRYGQIQAKHSFPRSYIVTTDKRTVRRNRFHLIKAPKGEQEDGIDLPDNYPTSNRADTNEAAEVPQSKDFHPVNQGSMHQGHQQTRSGRNIHRPNRLIENC